VEVVPDVPTFSKKTKENARQTICRYGTTREAEKNKSIKQRKKKKRKTKKGYGGS
jgi:hypothetical protein